MTDKTPTTKLSSIVPSMRAAWKSATSRKFNTKLVAVLAAGLIVLGGGITASAVGVGNYNAKTTNLCATAVTTSASAATDAKTALAASDAALLAVTVLELPLTAEGTAAGNSTDYAARAAVEGIAAVEAVTAVTASDGVDGIEAVAGVEAVPARASGADLVSDVSASRAALTKANLATTCTDRGQAEALTTQVAQSKAASAALNAGIAVLTSDFAVFQTDEAARIAAEIEAARVAAEAAAAEAARVAAAAEAARVAANQAAAKRAANYSPSPSVGGSTSGGYSGGSGSSGGGQSFDMGFGHTPGNCWTVDSNGTGVRC